jgi:hypothetical protein
VSDSKTLREAMATLAGLVEAPPTHYPRDVIGKAQTYRQACRLAWKLRRVRNLTKRTLCDLTGLYAAHVTDYFSVKDNKRELPARHIAAVEAVLGNTVVSQWIAQQSKLTVMEELQAERRRGVT